MANPFDLSKELALLKGTAGWAKLGWRMGRTWGANRQREELTAQYGAETAEAIVQAIIAGRNTAPIIERAERLKKEKEERDALLANPPPLHGSAAWASPDQLQPFLKDRADFDSPQSIVLGTYFPAGSTQPKYVHWDDEGHLLTLAPTRTGKSVTTIIPNLLRYRGSAIVFDPKGELYEKTSAWRAANVGPVYRIAPFDDGSDPTTRGFPRHGLNPLAEVRSQRDARAIAQLMFPRDPHAPEFFNDDAASFLTAVIQYVLTSAPEHRRNFPTVREAVSAPIDKFKKLVSKMRMSPVASIREAADNVLGKSPDRGLPNLRDTLHSKLSLWSDPEVVALTDRDDFRFSSLKDHPATVYITVPFRLIETYAPVLKVILKSALDGTSETQRKPKYPVLFVLDEFLSLGPFPEFRSAIRTHASAGVRLWFFLQELGELQKNYPGTSWHAFFNTSARQFFGIDDQFTAGVIAEALGNQTLAFRSTQVGTNTTAQLGNWSEDGSAGVAVSHGESIQFVGRPLMSPDEIMADLSGWKPNNTRNGIVHLRGARPFKVVLVPYEHSETCKARIGAYRVGESDGAGADTSKT